MSKVFTDKGHYKVKETGESVNYDYEYEQITGVDEIDESKAVSLINRLLKVDANNNTREKTKSANGHSERQALTEEQKLANKEKRAIEKQALSKLKGLDADTLAKLGITL